MRIKPVFPPLLLCALFSCASSPPLAVADSRDAPPDTIVYTLQPDLSQSPHLHVTATYYKNNDNEIVTVQFPVWSPGDYNIQNHAQYVQNLHAVQGLDQNAPHELRAMHSDANTWQIQNAARGRISVEYDIPESAPGNFSENVHFTDTHVFANGPAIFLYFVGHKDNPVRLEVAAGPNGKGFVPLEPDKSNAGFFAAPNYDTLADSPILITAPDAATVRTFSFGGTTFRTLFFDHPDRIRDPDAYTPVIQKLVQAETAIMGPMPTSHYDFFFDVDGRGGGLEHLNACRIALPSYAPPRRLAPFIAHEFFHLWNVKRIRPEVLGPFDYINPPKTRNLWFAEGITEYYAQLATCRAGFYTDDELFSHFRAAIRRYLNTPARKKITADEASLRVWETETSQGYGGLSYYAKGELIGLCLDLKIRHITENRKSLDDLMRLLMQRHAPPKPGYKEDELRELLSEVAGQDLSKFYGRLARSTEELPFEECLGYAGLDASCRPLQTVTGGQSAFQTRWISGK